MAGAAGSNSATPALAASAYGRPPARVASASSACSRCCTRAAVARALSTALAYLIYFRILARAGATNVLLVTFLIPVSAILLGTLVLGERLEPRHLVGMAAIGLGLAAIDGRPLKLAYRVGTGFSPR